MKIVAQIILFFLCVNFQLNAQDSEDDGSKNEVFIAIGGPSVIGSINYERRFIVHEKAYLSARIGVGIIHLNDFTNKFNPDILIPIGVNFNYVLKRLNNSNLSVSIGAGNTVASIVVLGDDYSPDRINNNSGFVKIGIKWTFKQFLNIGLAYTPIFENYKTIRHWGGISIGYSF